MGFFEDNLWWIGGFVIITVLCVVAMLWRNHVAKSDTVLRTEKDTVSSSVSLKPKRNTKKLD